MRVNGYTVTRRRTDDGYLVLVEGARIGAVVWPTRSGDPWRWCCERGGFNELGEASTLGEAVEACAYAHIQHWMRDKAPTRGGATDGVRHTR